MPLQFLYFQVCDSYIKGQLPTELSFNYFCPSETARTRRCRQRQCTAEGHHRCTPLGTTQSSFHPWSSVCHRSGTETDPIIHHAVSHFDWDIKKNYHRKQNKKRFIFYKKIYNPCLAISVCNISLWAQCAWVESLHI